MASLEKRVWTPRNCPTPLEPVTLSSSWNSGRGHRHVSPGSGVNCTCDESTHDKEDPAVLAWWPLRLQKHVLE